MTSRAVLWIAVSSAAQAGDEKESLPEQERKLRTLAEQRGWDVVDVLVIDGHSRVYYNFREFADAALLEGIDAPLRMFDHWQRRDFDVFACVAGDRFGREQSIFAEVVARTIDMGACVFTLRDGEINASNRRMFVSMAGYSASVEIDELKRRRNFGMNRRAERGLPTSSNVLRSHVVIRDDYGNALRLEVDESQRRLWDDVYRLIVDQHLPWGQLEAALYGLGHTRPDGKPLAHYSIHECVTSPTWWGNSARFHSVKNSHRQREWGWVYDPAQPPPDHVILHRDTHPGVYEGEMRARFIAEIERRRRSSLGRSRPYRTNRYAGLIVCMGCHCYMTYNGSDPFRYLTCRTSDGRRTCDNYGMLKPVTIDAYVRAFQARLSAGESLAGILQLDDGRAENQRLQTQLASEIEQAEHESDALITLQRTAHRRQQANYQKQIDALGATIELLEAQLERARYAASILLPRQQVAAIEFASLGEKLWALSDTDFNALLSRALGGYRLMAFNREIHGFIEAPLGVGRPRLS